MSKHAGVRDKPIGVIGLLFGYVIGRTFTLMYI